MVKTFVGIGSRVSIDTASVTRYCSIGNTLGEEWANSEYSTEALAEIKCRNAGTASELHAQVLTNGRASANTVTLRKNNADTALTLSITAATTGLFSDTGESVSIADGDDYCIKVVNNDSTGTFTFKDIAMVYEPSSGSAVQMGCCTDFSYSASSLQLTFYLSFPGVYFGNQFTESNIQSECFVATTFSDLQVYIAVNDRSNNSSMVFRDNGADGNQSVTITGSTTGKFEDTSNSDVLSVGDKYNLKLVRASGSSGQSVEVSSFSMLLTTNGTGFPILANGFGASLSTGTEYSPVFYYSDNFSTESDAEYYVPFGVDTEDLSGFVQSNSSTTTTTVQFRVDGSNVNQSFSVSAASTGRFTDASNTDTINSGSSCTVSIGGMDAAYFMRDLGIFATPVAAAGYANNVNGVSNAAIGEVIDVLKANVSNVMGA